MDPAETLDVTVVDVSMRDGLQAEAVFVPLAAKLQMAELLVAAGVRALEVTSFVHPRLVPQLADAEALVAGLLPHPGVRYSALTLNQRGYRRLFAALAAAGLAAEDVEAVFVTSASERHARANNNSTIAETLAIFDQIADQATRDGVGLRAVIACSFGTPFPDEHISEQRVAEIAAHFAARDARVITLADTVGLAEPGDIGRVVRAVRANLPNAALALHLHDNHGNAAANADAGLRAGIRRFEAGLAELGGCPFAPGSTANLDLLALHALIRAHGLTDGLNVPALELAATTFRAFVRDASPIESTANV